MAQFYCTVRGTIATAQLGEIFQHSIAVVSSLSQSAVADALELTFRNAFGTASTKLMGLTSNQCTYNEVTAAQITRLDGTPPDALMAATHKAFSPVLNGGSGTFMLPAQSTVAVSLTAGTRPNGSPYKGRFYLPPSTITYIDQQGKISSTARTQYTNWAGEWLNAMRAAGIDPSVWSRAQSVLSPVGSVRIGDRVDTQRSRRNKGVETYSTSVIT
jgi:hypothetical protein